VLIHAAASAVGLQCVQLARHFNAGLIIATARTERARGLPTVLGADQVLTVSDSRFSDRVLELTHGRGADVIIDHVGGPYLAENIRCAGIKGRLVGVGRLGGVDGVLDMEAVAFKRPSILGVTFRTRDAVERAALWLPFGLRPTSTMRRFGRRPSAYSRGQTPSKPRIFWSRIPTSARSCWRWERRCEALGCLTRDCDQLSRSPWIRRVNVHFCRGAMHK